MRFWSLGLVTYLAFRANTSRAGGRSYNVTTDIPLYLISRTTPTLDLVALHCLGSSLPTELICAGQFAAHVPPESGWATLQTPVDPP